MKPALTAVFLVVAMAGGASAQTNNPAGETDAAIREVLIRVADRQLRLTATDPARRTLADGSYPLATSLSVATNATRPSGLEWDYPWGVNLYGLLQAYRATGNTNYLEFVLNHNRIVGSYYFWLRSLQNSLTNTSGLSTFQQGTALREFFILDRLDYCGSMTAQLLEGVLNYSDAISIEQLETAQRTAKWIAGGGQSRLPDGTLWRTNANPNYTIWADDLYMSCPFLVRWYQYTGDTRYLDDAALQIMNMAGYLQDTNGIWFHGYYVNTSSVNGIKWGRANGWAMVATTEVLDALPPDHPARANVLNILRRHIEGIESVQQPSGMWRQILDYNSSSNWAETSCTAMYAYCIAKAVNRGWIDPTNMAIARKAFAALAQNVTTNGAVNGTCRGTSISTSIKYYLTYNSSNPDYPRPPDDMHGRGPVLLAGSEILLRPQLTITADSSDAAISWPAGVRRARLEVSPDLLDWSAFAELPVQTTNQDTRVTDPLSAARFYRLHMDSPQFPTTPLAFEGESLDSITNGATASISVDTNASGGFVMTLNADAAGDYIEFTVPNVPAGVYRLKIAFETSPAAGRFTTAVDGEPIGDPVDEYWYAAGNLLMDAGAMTFATAADHEVRLTVDGKHGASAGYAITVDRFVFAPQD